MYTRYFGLNKAPFKISPDPEYFFAGGNRGAVLEALIYAVARGEGIVKVVGEVGSGKTMLCRMLERELPADREIVYLANPHLSPDEILHAIAIELQLKVARGASKAEVMRLLQACLLEKHANNRSVVMFIEEAQGMGLDTLEEIRLLSNLETTQDKLLQIVLFGQPELNDKLRLHEIRQLKERITYAFDLTPLNRAEIRDYLNIRIRTSGFRGNDLFTPAAIRVLERHSEGILRRINILADKSLLAAFSRGDRIVKPRHLRMAVKDCEFDGPARYRPAVLGGGMTIAVALLATGAWWINQRLPARLADVPAIAAPSLPSAALTTASVEALEMPGKEDQIAADGDRTLERTASFAKSPPLPSQPLAVGRLISLDALEMDTSPVLTTENLIKLFE